MSALTWLAAVRQYLRRDKSRTLRHRRTKPRVERLEGYTLLSGARGLLTIVPGTQVGLFQPQAAVANPVVPQPALQESIADAMTPKTITQMLSVPDTLTNFSQPLTPLLNFFDPALGTLLSVTITGTASVTSQIQTQNTSPNSNASNVRADVIGNFSMPVGDPSGHTLAASFMQTTAPNVLTLVKCPPPCTITFMPPSGHTFEPLTASGSLNGTNGPLVITDAADLAFFTASAGHTDEQLTLTANANATATATNGNLTTEVATSGKGSLTVVYTYMPVCAPPPNVINVIHTGIHHQPTNVIITFDAALNPQGAQNVQNYQIVAHNHRGEFTGPGTRVIPIASAAYDPAANTVTLATAEHLNVHHHFQLTVNIPGLSQCGNGQPFVTVFGGKGDLGPVNFHGHIIVIGSHAQHAARGIRALSAPVSHGPAHPTGALLHWHARHRP